VKDKSFVALETQKATLKRSSGKRNHRCMESQVTHHKGKKKKRGEFGARNFIDKGQ